MKRVVITYCVAALLLGVLINSVGASGPFSYEHYGKVLNAYVDERGKVDYQSLKADSAELGIFLSQLEHLEPEQFAGWVDEAKIAFWINTYNALTLKVIVDHYPIEASLLGSLRFPTNSIRQIPGVWDRITFDVMEQKVTLDHIEHQILRKEFQEPRIHMALVCAAHSCPFLRQEPYEGSRLDEQLTDQTFRFLSVPGNLRIDRSRKRVFLSSVFRWFGEDFIDPYGTGTGFEGHSAGERAVLRFVSLHLEGADRQYLEQADYRIRYLDYDWTLNERKNR